MKHVAILGDLNRGQQIASGAALLGHGDASVPRGHTHRRATNGRDRVLATPVSCWVVEPAGLVVELKAEVLCWPTMLVYGCVLRSKSKPRCGCVGVPW